MILASDTSVRKHWLTFTLKRLAESMVNLRREYSFGKGNFCNARGNFRTSVNRSEVECRVCGIPRHGISDPGVPEISEDYPDIVPG